MLILSNDRHVNNQSEGCVRGDPTHTAMNCGIDSWNYNKLSLLLLRLNNSFFLIFITISSHHITGEREMENVHLAVEEDDLYSGYNDYNPTFDSEVS